MSKKVGQIKEQTKEFELKQKDFLYEFKMEKEQRWKLPGEEFYIKLKAQKQRGVQVIHREMKLRKQEQSLSMEANKIKEQTKEFEVKYKHILDEIELEMEQKRKSLDDMFYIKLEA